VCLHHEAQAVAHLFVGVLVVMLTHGTKHS
jgi:hypothetical protein